jgi:nucleoid-associated protein YgaU
MASPDVLRHPPAVPNPAGPDATGATQVDAPVEPARRSAPRPPRSVTPGGLAAAVLATGQDTRLGLERLPARRGGGARRRSLLRPALALMLVAALAVGLGWLGGGDLAAGVRAATAVGRTSGGPADDPNAGAPAASAAIPRDLEGQRASALAAPPPAAEEMDAPGGLAVSIHPVESNYTVVAGDTLERIAGRFGTTIDALVGINNLGDRNTLRVGQKLIIP